MNIKEQPKKKLGLLIIKIGFAFIGFAILLKLLGVPVFLLGFYLGPILIGVGGSVMIFNKNAD